METTMPEFDLMEAMDYKRLRKSILTKIPDSLRGEIWCMICQVKREKASHAPGFYEKLLTFENEENEHRIQKDVDRTFNNCLLYTSPSPRDMRRSRMPSSA